MKGCLIKLWKIVLYTLGGITALVLLAIILSLFAKPKAIQSPGATPVAAKQAVAIAQTSTSTAAPPTSTPTAGPSPTSPPPTSTPQPTPTPTSPPTQTPSPIDTPLPQNEILITQEQYGDEWPFTVKQGVLSCENVSEVVLTADGVSFAINGTAKSAKKYQAVERIWADNPAIPGTKKSVGGIIKSGLALCP